MQPRRCPECVQSVDKCMSAQVLSKMLDEIKILQPCHAVLTMVISEVTFGWKQVLLLLETCVMIIFIIKDMIYC